MSVYLTQIGVEIQGYDNLAGRIFQRVEAQSDNYMSSTTMILAEPSVSEHDLCQN